MPNALTITTPNADEVVITRTFKAPRTLVFDAMTKPELLTRWMSGPPGWVFAVCEVDLRVNGKFRFVWRSDAGEEMGMGGVHLEIAAPERVVQTQLFDQDWTGGEAIGTMIITEHNGVSTMVNTVRYSSQEARDAVLRTPMDQGMEMGYQRLDTVLATIANGGN